MALFVTLGALVGCQDGTPTATTGTACGTGTDADARVVDARVKFATLDDDKRADSVVLADLSGPGWRSLFHPSGRPADERLGADEVWADRSVTEAFDAKVPGSGLTRRRLLEGGTFAVTLLPLGDPLPDPLRNADTWVYAWRMSIRFDSGRVDSLSSLARPSAPRAAATRITADPEAARPADGAVPEGGTTVWSYCDALRSSDAPAPDGWHGALWDTLWFDWHDGPTPRAQFFTGTGLTGDKLDLDVTSSGSAVRDLRAESACGDLLACADSWVDVIRSLSTTGGGQQAVYVVARDERTTDGAAVSPACLVIPPHVEVEDLDRVFVSTGGPAGGVSEARWGRRIDVVEVHTAQPPREGCSYYRFSE